MPSIPLNRLPLTDGVVMVRALDARDAQALATASQDPEILRWTLIEEGLTASRVQAWIDEVTRDMESGGTVRLAIVDGATDAVVGQVGLAPEWNESTGELFYWLAAPARGRRLTARAVRLVAAWALSELGMARVEICVDARNGPSLGVARAAGFVEEGMLRSAQRFKGERIDTVVFSRLPHDP